MISAQWLRAAQRQRTLFLFLLWLAGCSAAGPLARQSISESVTKNVSFAVLEDYDKGEDLTEVAKDFALMKDLHIDVLRCSFGWDDYEPERGQYDFVWLKQFVELAERHGIKIRPYIGYTPRWAGTAGSADGMDWNNPPADYKTWYDFVYHLVYALRDYPNVLSYEIYNEENVQFWWDGSIDQYKETLRQGALAVRAANPNAQVLLGGFVFPDVNWLRSITQDGLAPYYDVTPFHAYPETWTESGVVVENYLGRGYREFARENESLGQGKPIWINEMGFSATPDQSELKQANWWARAVSTFLADPAIEHIGVYEIKDLPLNKETIGDEKNHYLGITRVDRSKKLAFYTVRMLVDLLNTGKITTADGDVTVTVTAGKPGQLYWHLFKRLDGKQVFFVYDKSGSPTVRATFRTSGATALKYALDGSSITYSSFDGRVLTDIHLTAGSMAIFRIDP